MAAFPRRKRSADQRDRKARMLRNRTGRAVLVLAMIALLVLPAVFLADPISYVPLVAALLLIVVSWVYLRILRRSLSVGVGGIGESCERGQNVDLAMTLTNTFVLPFPRIDLDIYVTDLFGGYDSERTLMCSLGSRESLQVEFGVLFSHLGTYRVGVSRMVVHDLIGLFSWTKEGDSWSSVTVRPRWVDIGEVGDMRTLPDESTRALRPVAADDVDYSSVREYRYGDPLKTVHWNLSARSADGSLYTRVFETFTAPSLVIVVDPCAPEFESEDLMSLFDGMVEVAAALASLAREDGMDCTVRFARGDGSWGATELATAEDADKMVSEMTRPLTGDDASRLADDAEEMLDVSGPGLYGAANVALVTSRIDSGLIAALSDVAVRGWGATAFVAVPRSLEGKNRDRFLAPLHRWESVGVAYGIVESDERTTEVLAP